MNMESDAYYDEKCIICIFFGKGSFSELQDGVYQKISSKGLNGLKEASKKRNDQFKKFIDSQILEKKELQVHKYCRFHYVKEDFPNLLVKQNESCEAKSTEKTSPNSAKLRDRVSLNTSFDFQNKCFMCAEIKQSKDVVRNPFSTVSNPDFSITVLDLLDRQITTQNEHRELRTRILGISDLTACKAIYHRNCFLKLKNNCRASSGKDNVLSPKINRCMARIYQHIDAQDDCQFTLEGLKELFEDDEYKPSDPVIKERLKKYYGKENIIILSKKHGKTFICLKSACYDILSKDFEQQNENAKARILCDTTAKLLQREITTPIFEEENYPASDALMSNLDNDISEHLLYFLQKLIQKRNNELSSTQKRIAMSLAHAITAAVRPRSFRSSLHLALAVTLHRKFGSRKIINICNSLGFCASYKEASLYEASVAMQDEPEIIEGTFIQFVYDNADFNVDTLDGKGTFHNLGGIKIITPAEGMKKRKPIPRLESIPLEEQTAEHGHINIVPYPKIKGAGLELVEIQKPNNNNLNLNPTYATNLTYYWMLLQYLNENKDIGWNGFMEKLYKSDIHFSVSTINFQPFINSSPSDYSTLYTAMKESVKFSKIHRMKTCIITMDQPLYYKLFDITEAIKLNPGEPMIVARLGGFHTLLSFFGCIGYIMSGSGILELLTEVYAEKTAECILDGRQYARALRAHSLIQLTLAEIIFDQLKKKNESFSSIVDSYEELMGNFIDDYTTPVSLQNTTIFKDFVKLFEGKLIEYEQGNNKTAKLWILYFRMICIVKDFIAAEKSGNWNLHLQTIERMIPFFHSSGHFPYAKSATMYLQSMKELNFKMNDNEYKKFSEGYFTIYRKKERWGGIFSDQTIEQTMMKMLSVEGGPFKRGVTESVVYKWIKGVLQTKDIMEGIEQYCGISFEKTYQHKDTSTPRLMVDANCIEKLRQFFNDHNPFDDSDALISLSSGIVADDTINCFKAFEHGKQLMASMAQNFKNFKEISLKRSDKVKTLAHMNNMVSVHDNTIPINPYLIFQRVCILKKDDPQFEDFFLYELAPYPLSIFDEYGFRKNEKSELYNFFEETTQETSVDYGYILDGGMLLHKTKWKVGEKLSIILDNYIRYIRYNFGNSTCVIFDGYDNISTKSWERSRRERKYVSVDYRIDKDSVLKVTQDRFLANINNKKRFIALFMEALLSANFPCEQAKGDADRLIVTTAISNKYFPSKKMIVVSEDIDVLILLTSLSPPDEEYFLLKPKSSTGTQERKIFSTKSFKKEFENCKNDLLFLHAFSGCDTTSAFYNKGKKNLFNKFQKNEKLKELVQVFKTPVTSVKALIPSGLECLYAIYNCESIFCEMDDAEERLKKIRHYIFIRQNTAKIKSELKKKIPTSNPRNIRNKEHVGVDIATLPPTFDSFLFHLKRVYYQIQAWIGIFDLDPEEWGWQENDNVLCPVKMEQPPAPEIVMNVISCACKKGCKNYCGCRKKNIRCTIACLNCQGNCTNIANIEAEEYEELLSEEDECSL